MATNTKPLKNGDIIRGALFSDCRTWRYLLWRQWDVEKGTALFVGLNPSTADENNDDPTIRRCVNFAKSWGYGGIQMMNLFAYRATDPKVMKSAALHMDVTGPRNRELLTLHANKADIAIAAWGVDGDFLLRSKWAVENLPKLHYLALTKSGEPRHPLYLSKDLKPIPYLVSHAQ